MAQTETSPVDKKDRAKDKRLQREYGITFAEHERRRAEQNNCCACCGREFIKPPHVDHKHFTVEAVRAGNGWMGKSSLQSTELVFGPTKASVVARVRKEDMPRAVRGLLCGPCNRGIGKLEDPRFFHGDPDLIIKAAEYLRRTAK